MSTVGTSAPAAVMREQSPDAVQVTRAPRPNQVVGNSGDTDSDDDTASAAATMVLQRGDTPFDTHTRDTLAQIFGE